MAAKDFYVNNILKKNIIAGNWNAGADSFKLHYIKQADSRRYL